MDTTSDPRQQAVDRVNRTPTDRLYTLEGDTERLLGLHSGLLRYSRTPREDIRALLRREADAYREMGDAPWDEPGTAARYAAYWDALADRVRLMPLLSGVEDRP